MTTLGFDNYVEPLKIYLNKYREEEKNGPKRKFIGGGLKKESNDSPTSPPAIFNSTLSSIYGPIDVQQLAQFQMVTYADAENADASKDAIIPQS